MRSIDRRLGPQVDPTEISSSGASYAVGPRLSIHGHTSAPAWTSRVTAAQRRPASCYAAVGLAANLESALTLLPSPHRCLA